MELKGIGKREIDQLDQCGCCPLTSPFCVPAPRPSCAYPSAQPAKLPAVLPKIVSTIDSPSKPLPSPSKARSENYDIINLDDLKKEIIKQCAYKTCVLKMYNKIHTNFISYANEKQNKNI